MKSLLLRSAALLLGAAALGLSACNTLTTSGGGNYTVVARKPTNPNNVYWRQVISFWEGMAQLPLHGAVDTELYLATQGESLFLRAKFADISEEATGNTFMPNTKKLVDSSEKATAMFEGVKKNLAARRAQVIAAKETATA